MYQREAVEAMREKVYRARRALDEFEEAIKKVRLFGEVATRGEAPAHKYCVDGLVAGVEVRISQSRDRLNAITSNVEGMSMTVASREQEATGYLDEDDV